jgi:hypothetical protein
MYSLFDSASSKLGLIVCRKPLKSLNLDLSEIDLYIENLKEYDNAAIDSLILVDLIVKSKEIDTSSLTDTEIRFRVLVNSKEENVNEKEAVQKMKTCFVGWNESIAKLVKKFNDKEPYRRVLDYISRPIYDNSMKYALVSVDMDHGGSTNIYHLEDGKWKIVGRIR